MNNICKYCLSTTTCCDDIETENCSNYIEFQKEPKQEKERGLIIKKSDGSIIKQETIEEAAEKYKYNPKGDFCFTKGAKWQAERMYSEEDLKEAYLSAIETTGEGWNGEYAEGNDPNIEEKFSKGFTQWFEQFKKKQNE